METLTPSQDLEGCVGGIGAHTQLPAAVGDKQREPSTLSERGGGQGGSRPTQGTRPYIRAQEEADACCETLSS